MSISRFLYFIVIGDEEVKNKQVTLESRDPNPEDGQGGEKEVLDVEELIKKLEGEK